MLLKDLKKDDSFFIATFSVKENIEGKGFKGILEKFIVLNNDKKIVTFKHEKRDEAHSLVCEQSDNQDKINEFHKMNEDRYTGFFMTMEDFSSSFYEWQKRNIHSNGH